MRTSTTREPATTARPPAREIAPRLPLRGLLSLQASAGNAAVARAVDDLRVVQRVVKWAGFDRRVGGGAADVLVTDGLMNCVAVVAYDPVRRAAVLAHYDTMNAYTGKAFSTARLFALRTLLTEDLQRLTGVKSPPEFHVGMGAVWFDIDQEDPAWLMRHDLLLALTAVFGAEPVRCGSRIQFRVETGEMAGNKRPSPGTPLAEGPVSGPEPPDTWRKSGAKIDYDALKKLSKS